MPKLFWKYSKTNTIIYNRNYYNININITNRNILIEIYANNSNEQ